MVLLRLVRNPSTTLLEAESLSGIAGWRYIGATRPNVVGWAVGDRWLDTSDPSTDGNVTRLWTGSSFSPEDSGFTPPGTLLFSDDFTGADGAVWDASKWGLGRNTAVATPTAAGGATLLSGRGVLAASSSTVDYDPLSTVSRRAIFTDATDVNVLLTFQFDATNSFFGIHVRHSTNAIDRKDGYWLQIAKETGKWSIQKLDGSYVSTLLGTEQSQTYVENTPYRARFYAVGSAIKAKIWLASADEPGSWGVEVTDTTYSVAGKTGLSVSGGAVNPLARRVFVDDLVIRAS